MSNLSRLEELFAGISPEAPKPLPRSTVEHDTVDEMVFRNYAVDSPRFARLAVEDPPVITPDAPEPDPIDFGAATPEEVAEWHGKVKAARDARDQGIPYTNWEELTRDYFYLHHHPSPPTTLAPGEYDPQVEIHRKIAEKTTALDDWAATRNVTRDNATLSAMAVMSAAKTHLKSLLENELADQVRQAEEYREKQQQAQDAEDQIREIRDGLGDAPGDIPDDVVAQVEQLVAEAQAARDKAQQIADAPIPFSRAAQDKIEAAAGAARQAAEEAAGTPSFGQGFGTDEPKYESPEQALSIAERWANNPTLKGIAERYGKMDPDTRFKRAKRVTGGQDEIVDLEFGDNLKRATFTELGNLVQDEVFLDDFYARYLAGEILQYTTVGEEHAGRGPIGFVLDGSSSMSGERNMWARAVCLTGLSIARREKRDCFVVEFSAVNQVESWEFPVREALDAQTLLDMASHFFGHTTHPLVGVNRGVEIIDRSPTFRKADLVILSDGEAPFGDEDRRLRDHLLEKGVRIHGIGIGQTFGYLKNMCDPDSLVHVHDFELDGDPNAATSSLAVHIN